MTDDERLLLVATAKAVSAMLGGHLEKPVQVTELQTTLTDLRSLIAPVEATNRRLGIG